MIEIIVRDPEIDLELRWSGGDVATIWRRDLNMSGFAEVQVGTWKMLRGFDLTAAQDVIEHPERLVTSSYSAEHLSGIIATMAAWLHTKRAHL